MADRVDVNGRTVYRHFGNERSLRDTVMHRQEEEAGIDLAGIDLERFALSVRAHGRRTQSTMVMATFGQARAAASTLSRSSSGGSSLST